MSHCTQIKPNPINLQCSHNNTLHGGLTEWCETWLYNWRSFSRNVTIRCWNTVSGNWTRMNTNFKISRICSSKITLCRISAANNPLRFYRLRGKHPLVLRTHWKVSPLYVLEDKLCFQRIPMCYKNEVEFLDTISRRTSFRDTVVPCRSKCSHNVVQLIQMKINIIFIHHAQLHSHL